jgi:RNA polymerase sigma-70 factor, ECF subfamily
VGLTSLTTSFVQGVGDAYALDENAAKQLGPVLDALLESARAAWPTVKLSGAAFGAHLATVAPDAEDLDVALRGMNTDDLYLACACALADDGAIRAFEASILPRAARAAARIDGDANFVQEVCSEVRVKLLVSGDAKPPRIAHYLGRGPLAHWVQVTAMRVAQTFKRNVRKEEARGEMPDIVSSILGEDPELAPFAEQLREPFAKAFGEALAELTARERNVLRMYLIEEVSAEQIGGMYRVHRATVARWVAQARRKVHAGTKRRLAREVELGPTSFESVMSQMMSGIDLSLASFLGP